MLTHLAYFLLNIFMLTPYYVLVTNDLLASQHHTFSSTSKLRYLDVEFWCEHRKALYIIIKGNRVPARKKLHFQTWRQYLRRLVHICNNCLFVYCLLSLHLFHLDFFFFFLFKISVIENTNLNFLARSMYLITLLFSLTFGIIFIADVIVFNF